MVRPAIRLSQRCVAPLLTLFLVGVTAAGCRGGTPGTRSTGSNPQQRPNGVKLSLAEEREQTRRAGIALSPQELQSPTIPDDQNAAVLYRKLDALLKSQPLNDKILFAVLPRVDRPAPSAAEWNAAQRLLAERHDVVELAHRIAGMERCNFHRNWSLGAAVKFPEYVRMRLCARIIAVEGLLSARAGEQKKAIANLAQGFRFGQHAAAEPTSIGHLVSVACDSILFSGLAELLRVSPPDAELAVGVRKVVSAYRSPFDGRKSLRGDATMVAADLERLRTRGWKALHQLLGSSAAEVSKAQSWEKMTPQERTQWRSYMDASEADYLRRLRLLAETVNLPYSQRKLRLKQLEQELESDKGDLTVLISAIMLPSLPPSDERREARRATLEAGAAVLEYRARHQSWPDRLETAMERVPLDPYTGKSLLYRVEDTGFVVYSVGETGAFDGGAPGVKTKETGFFRYTSRSAAKSATP